MKSLTMMMGCSWRRSLLGRRVAALLHVGRLPERNRVSIRRD